MKTDTMDIALAAILVTICVVSATVAVGAPAPDQSQSALPPPPDTAQTAADQEPVRLTAQELDKLVVPIALYPDPLVAQILPASTYPLEVVQASRWLDQRGKLEGKELETATADQPWAASVKALCAFPDVLPAPLSGQRPRGNGHKRS